MFQRWLAVRTCVCQLYILSPLTTVGSKPPSTLQLPLYRVSILCKNYEFIRVKMRVKVWRGWRIREQHGGEVVRVTVPQVLGSSPGRVFLGFLQVLSPTKTMHNTFISYSTLSLGESENDCQVCLCDGQGTVSGDLRFLWEWLLEITPAPPIEDWRKTAGEKTVSN